jgi:hypothetical protein
VPPDVVPPEVPPEVVPPEVVPPEVVPPEVVPPDVPPPEVVPPNDDPPEVPPEVDVVPPDVEELPPYPGCPQPGPCTCAGGDHQPPELLPYVALAGTLVPIASAAPKIANPRTVITTLSQFYATLQKPHRHTVRLFVMQQIPCQNVEARRNAGVLRVNAPLVLMVNVKLIDAETPGNPKVSG